MNALTNCRCSDGKYTLNALTFLGANEKQKKVAQVGEDLTLFETVTTYVFEAKCVLCGRLVKFKASTEEEIDMVLDMLLPWCMHWIDPKDIAFSPKQLKAM